MTIDDRRLVSKGPTPIAVQQLVCSLFGVHHYDDVFEKISRWPPFSTRGAPVLRRRIDPAVAASPLLFIHIPKNAGTAIASAVYGHSPGHKTAHFYRVATAGMFDRAEAFAVLRDPVERFVSAYWFIRNQGGDEVAVEPGFARTLAGVESVDQMLDFVERHSDRLYALDHVLRPQWWYVCDPQGRLIVERLYLIDEHRAALAAFLSAFGVAEIPVRNRTDKGELTLSPGQVARVRSIYARDVEMVERLRGGAQPGASSRAGDPALRVARREKSSA